jgi:RNA polymerase sigma-70 factor (ECF subfamily)
MESEPDELIPTRESLLSRLKDWEDSSSWREFFNTYWKLIYGVAVKAGLTHAEAQDVVQETVLGVAKRIGEFKYDPAVCSFKGWLLTVTRKRIATQFERRKRVPVPLDPLLDGTGHTDVLERLPDPAGLALEALWDAEWEKNLMDAALARVRRKVPIEQYQIFDFYVLKNWPAREVARTLKVTVGHVYVAKHRISRLIRKEMQTLERKSL